MTSAFDRFEAVLADAGCEPKRQGDRISSKCPSHEDKHPSLSANRAPTGGVLVTCHAGCSAEAIVSALGLTLADLFEQPAKTKARITDVYPYNGFEIVREQPKSFFVRRPDGHGGYVAGLGSTPKALYRQDELPAAIEAGEWVLIVEGEADVDRIVREGFTATTNPFGAGKWLKKFNPTLRGARVAILGDNDDVGRRHVQHVARELQGVAKEVRVVTLAGLPEHGDISDWLPAGHTVEELERLIEVTPAVSTGSTQAVESGSAPTGDDPSRAQVRLDKYAPFSIGREHHLSAPARWLLVTLCLGADFRSRSLATTVVELALDTGLDRATVPKVLHALQDAGLISIILPFRQHQRGEVEVLAWERLIVTTSRPGKAAPATFPPAPSPQPEAGSSTIAPGAGPEGKAGEKLVESGSNAGPPTISPIVSRANAGSLRNKEHGSKEVGRPVRVNGQPIAEATEEEGALSGERYDEDFDDDAVPLSQEDAAIAMLLAAFPGSSVFDAADLADVV